MALTILILILSYVGQIMLKTVKSNENIQVTFDNYYCRFRLLFQLAGFRVQT